MLQPGGGRAGVMLKHNLRTEREVRRYPNDLTGRETMAMARIRYAGMIALAGLAALTLAIVGCQSTPVDTSSYAQGPGAAADALAGGQCLRGATKTRSPAGKSSPCIAAIVTTPEPGGAPYSNYQNVAAHCGAAPT